MSCFAIIGNKNVFIYGGLKLKYAARERDLMHKSIMFFILFAINILGSLPAAASQRIVVAEMITNVN